MKYIDRIIALLKSATAEEQYLVLRFIENIMKKKQ